ncbi:MAG: hypothetical protein U0166_18200 [Acidobacteriota bacterium]
MTRASRVILLAPAVLTTSCIVYDVEVIVDDDGAASLSIEVEDEHARLDVYERLLESPHVRITSCSESAGASATRVRLNARVADVRRLPDLPAFKGVRVFLEDLDETRTLLQVEHDALGTVVAGDLRVTLTLPRAPLQHGGAPLAGPRALRLEAPIAALEHRELRLWAVMPRE